MESCSSRVEGGEQSFYQLGTLSQLDQLQLQLDLGVLDDKWGGKRRRWHRREGGGSLTKCESIDGEAGGEERGGMLTSTETTAAAAK